MITKETFCSLLNTCRDLNSYINKLHSVEIELKDDNPCFSTIDTIIDCLDEEFQTNNVSYYFYERDCNGLEMNGKKVPFLWENDGTEIWVDSDASLYHYLSNHKDDCEVRKCR